MELNFSRTIIPAELKIAVELKFGGDPWVMGTLSPSAKRSAELKHNKNCSGTKIPVELKWGDPWVMRTPMQVQRGQQN